MPQSMKSSVSVCLLACALDDRSLVDSVEICLLFARDFASEQTGQQSRDLFTPFSALTPSSPTLA